MFKGGVYKTMTTVLTASALAAAPYNKRVLIVDADSQCNATAFFTPEPVDWQDDLNSSVVQIPGKSPTGPADSCLSLPRTHLQPVTKLFQAMRGSKAKAGGKNSNARAHLEKLRFKQFLYALHLSVGMPLCGGNLPNG